MSSVIDERVVQMSFDNDQFEKGVSQTITSLDKLDNALLGMTNSEYFQKMEEGIQKVEQAFSASGMVINGVLMSIGNTIYNYVLKGWNAFTRGITDGMGEYNTQMDATQTILANVKDEGKGIDDVVAALDELNAYADLTIYNFTEMTRNIGMFTAAGANLDTSVKTIKGLANAAALVGANSQTAARAWYQVSQAMSAGTFKLMDWKSLEVSNIAGEGFKTVLTEVARKDGLAVAKMIDNGTALRETLKDGWLTAERFSEAMEILTDELTEAELVERGYTEEQAKMLKELSTEAMFAATKVKTFAQLMDTLREAIGSGWAVTFRTIIGDFERARTFFTRISTVLNDAVGKIADYRNKFLDEIWNGHQFGGGSAYDDFKDTIDNLLAIFTTFVGAIRAGFDNIFPWDDIKKDVGNFTEFMKRTTESFVLNDKQSSQKIIDTKNLWDLDAINEDIKNLTRIFRGLFAAVDTAFTIIKDTFGWIIKQIPGMGVFFNRLEKGNKTVIGNLADLMDNITKIRDIIKELNLIPRVLSLIKQEIINIINSNPLLYGLISFVVYAINVIKAFIGILKELNINPFTVLLGVLKVIGGAVGAIFKLIGDGINKLASLFTGKMDFSFLQVIGEELLKFIYILDNLGKGTITLSDVFEYYKQRVVEAFNGIINSPAVQGFINFFVGLWDTITGFWDNFMDLIDQVGTWINMYLQDFQFDPEKTGLFGGLIAGGLAVFAIFKQFKDLNSLINSITKIFNKLGDVLGAFANKLNSEALFTAAKGVGILAASLLVIALIPYDRLVDAISAVIVLTAALALILRGIQTTFDLVESIKDGFNPLYKAFDRLAKGLGKMLSKLGTALLLEAVGDALIKITIAIVGLAVAFKMIPNEMQSAIQVIGGIAAALAALIIVFEVLGNKRMKIIDAEDAMASMFKGFGVMARFAGIALIIEVFANAIVKISAAIALLTLIDDTKLLGAVGAIVAVTVVLGGMIALIEKCSKGLNGNALAGLTLTIFAFGIVVAALGVVAAIMGLLPEDVLLRGVLAVISIVIVMGTLLAVIEHNYKKNTEKVFYSLATMFVALAGGVAAIMLASTLIQNETQMNAMTGALIAMGVMLIAALGGMVAIMAYLSASGVTEVRVRQVAEIMKVVAISFGVILLSFGAAGALMGYFGTTAEQLEAMVAAIFLAIVGMAAIVAVVGMTKISEGLLYSTMAVILSVAAVFGVIGIVLNSLANITFDPSVLIALALMTGALVAVIGITFLLGVVIGALGTAGIGEIAIAGIAALAGTIAAFALYIAAIGVAAYLMSEAVLNMQQAMKNIFDAIMYIGQNGEEVLTNIQNAGQVIFAAVPSILEMFVNLGIAIGTAVLGLIIGLYTILGPLVGAWAKFILEVIVAISTWINENAMLIQTALTQLWSAILKLALIAFNVALMDMLPTLILEVLNFAVAAVSGLAKMLSMMMGAFTDYLIEIFGADFEVLGIPLQIWADSWRETGESIYEVGQGITSTIQGIIDWVAEGSLQIVSFFGTAEDAAVETTETYTECTEEIVDDNEAVGKSYDETQKAVSKSGEIQANDVAASSMSQLLSVENLVGGVETLIGGGLGDISDLKLDFFNTDESNQEEYFDTLMTNQMVFQADSVNGTAKYLEKNAQLYNDYYGEAGEAAETYYENMAKGSQLALAGDFSGAQAAYAAANAAKIELKEKYDVTAQDLLNDVFGWDAATGKAVGQYVSGQYDSWSAILGDLSNMWDNYTPSSPDMTAYTASYGSDKKSTSGTDESKLQKELNDRNDMINKADSEINPKDLTPTIDLDKLQNEVNQANGIVTGSLLAAQNAAIGDYINTDSELNPFLKDRYQNTYNFTQNNYSPKALSRIDIYRQTQNQLRLSRGM